MKWFFANFIAGVIRFVVAWILWNWTWLLGIIVATGIGGWAYINSVGYPAALAAVAIAFVTVLWTGIGLAWINSQRNRFDWTLAYTGMTLGLDTGNEDATLQIGINIVNVASSALKYEVEEFRTIIGDRTIPLPIFTSNGGIIPSNVARNYKFPAFKKETVEAFLGNRVSGQVEYVIAYGPHQSSFVRRLKMKHQIFLRLDDKHSVVDNIISEIEEDVY